MTIFIDAHYLEIGSNGVGTFILYLYKSIISRNRSYNFIFGAYNIEKIKKYFQYNDNVKVLKYKYKHQARFIFDIPKIINENNVDIAHFQYIMPIVKNRKTTYITTIHDILFIEFKKYFPFVYRVLRTFTFYISSRRSDIITTVSNYSKNALVKYFNVKKEKIYMVPLGTQLEKTDEEKIQKDITNKLMNKKYILYVSRFEPRKKQDELLETYIEMKLYEKNIFVVFVGFKSIKNDKFDILYDSIDIIQKNKIYIFNNVNDSTLSWLYENCLVFTYMSIAEGFGLPILEAAIRKKQVIFVGSTAMKDFEFLKNGIVKLDKNYKINKVEFIEKLQRAIDNRLYNQGELDKIKEIVLKNYNWNKIACEYEEIFIKNKSAI